MKKRLIDLEPSFMTQGIFLKLAELEVPWETSAEQLNLVYYANHSGQKKASPMVRTMASLRSDGKLAAEDEESLAEIAMSMFGDNWAHQYATLSFTYDPISNYNMEEHETPAETTRTRTPAEYTDTETPAETTETTTPAETTTTTTPAETTVTETPAETTETTTPAETTETTTPAETTASGGNEAGIYGFNSSDAVGSDTLAASTSYTTDEPGTVKLEVDTAGSVKRETDASGTVKTEVDAAGTVKVETDTAGTVKRETDAAGTTVRTVQSAESETLEINAERTLTRSGNIGVMSTQDMIQQEREVWTWNFFYDIVFTDLDRLLTLSVY